jgi:hypothetical protein
MFFLRYLKMIKKQKSFKTLYYNETKRLIYAS